MIMKELIDRKEVNDMTLATEKDKAFALAELSRRKIENTPKVIDNRSLYAGSDMYFYCDYCKALTDQLPEDYIPDPDTPKKICDECQSLKNLGWME